MKIPDTQKILTPQRLEGESFDEYKTRRHLANTSVKNYLKGQYIHQHTPGIRNKPYKKDP